MPTGTEAEGTMVAATVLDYRHPDAVSKYGPLRDRLAQCGRRHLTLSFDELSELVAGGLPASAYRHSAWWSNEADGRHVQSVSGWMAAGYVVDHVDQVARQVTFRQRG